MGWKFYTLVIKFEEDRASIIEIEEFYRLKTGGLFSQNLKDVAPTLWSKDEFEKE